MDDLVQFFRSRLPWPLGWSKARRSREALKGAPAGFVRGLQSRRGTPQS